MSRSPARRHRAGRTGQKVFLLSILLVGLPILGDRAAHLGAAGEPAGSPERTPAAPGNRSGPADAATATDLLEQARAAHGAGQLDEAADLYDRALDGFRAQHDAAGAAICLNNRSVIEHAQGDDAAALASAREAVSLRLAIGDRLRAGRSRTNAARALLGLARSTEAERLLLAALHDSRLADNAHDQVVTRINLAVLQLGAGRYGDALAELEAGLNVADSIPSASWVPHQRIILLNNRGVLFERIGEYRRALHDYETIEAILERDANVVPVLINAATILRNLGNADGALAKLERARAILGTAPGTAARRANLLSNIALVLHRNLGRLDEARRLLDEAIPLAREAGDRYETMRLENALGRLDLDLEQPEEAAAAFLRVLDDVAESAALEPAWEAHMGMAQVLLARRDRDLALRAVRTAAALVEGTRNNLIPRFAPRRLLADRLDVFAIYADLSAQSGTDAGVRDGLLATERARARLLLARGARGPGAWEEKVETMATLSRLSRQATDLYRGVAADAGPWRRTEAEWRASHDPVIPAGTPAGEAWIAYFVHADHSRAFWLAGTRSGSVSLPDEDRITRLSLAWRQALVNDDAAAERDAGVRLATAVLEPVLDRLPVTTRRLRLVADTQLWRIPLDALPLPRDPANRSGGERLLQRYTVSLVPSVAYAAIAGQPPASRPAAFFGPPPAPASDDTSGRRRLLPALPEAAAEAAALRKVTGPRSVQADPAAATEAQFRKSIAAPLSILHVATHATLDVLDAGRTGIVLARSEIAPGDAADDPSDDGFLSLPELLDLDMDTRLTVLSACSGATGETLPGEGLESLANALVESGSRTVIASLWDVNDLAARAFVEQFYYRLGQGLDVAGSLRAAKRTLMNATGALARPENWAGWVVIGDGSWRLTRASSRSRGFWWLGAAGLVIAAGLGGVALRRSLTSGP
ncbi:MAG: CHAT domain-containing protein [Acidobacteriota bacterium]